MAIPPFRESCVLPSLPIMNNVNSFVPFHNGSLLCLSLCLCLSLSLSLSLSISVSVSTKAQQ